jgi:hypothetical protein
VCSMQLSTMWIEAREPHPVRTGGTRSLNHEWGKGKQLAGSIRRWCRKQARNRQGHQGPLRARGRPWEQQEVCASYAFPSKTCGVKSPYSLERPFPFDGYEVHQWRLSKAASLTLKSRYPIRSRLSGS